MEVNYILNPDRDTSRQFYAKAREIGLVSFDVETNGLDPHENDLLLIQYALPTGQVLLYSEVIPPFMVSLLEEVLVLGHNLKFDIKFAKSKLNARFGKIYDTMIAEASIHLGKKLLVGLGAVAKRRLGIDMEKEIRSGFVGRPKGVPFSPSELEYAARDVALLFEIREQQLAEIEKLRLDKVLDLENDTVISTALMELRGIDFDQNSWNEIIEETEPQLVALVEDVYRRLGSPKPVHIGLWAEPKDVISAYVKATNLGSPDQNVADLRRMGYNVQNSDSDILALLAPHSWYAASLLEFRRLSKLCNAFLWPMRDHVNSVTGRIHPDYRQISSYEKKAGGGTVTGRFACSNPNFQQLPRDKRLRHCFVAPEGRLLATVDWSSQEIRIAANLSKDPVMVEFFLGDLTDYHGYMASKVFGYPIDQVSKMMVNGVEVNPPLAHIRHKAKTTNFALIYGTGPTGLARQFISMDAYDPAAYSPSTWMRQCEEAMLDQVEECREIIDSYRSTLTVLMPMLDNASRTAVRTGVISDHTIGRLRFFEPCKKDDLWKRERPAKNFPIQGTNASQMKLALNKVRDCKDLDADIVGTVHDEMLVLIREDRKEDLAVIEDIMVKAAGEILPGPVPYEVSSVLLPHWTK